MKKGLILACLIAFVVQYENFNHFVVMLVVGDFDVRQAWSNAFRYFDIKSAFFVGCFRLIPFRFVCACHDAYRSNDAH